MYFSAMSDVSIALISQGIPQLGDVKQRWYGKKTSLHAHTAVAHLPGIS